MKYIPFICGLLAVELAGCAASPEQQERYTFLRMQADNSVICESLSECNEKWERSAQWLRDNAYWNIRLIEEQRIETRKPQAHHYSRNWYRVNKVMRNDGSTVISLYASCLPSVHCTPETELAVGAFNHFVNTGQRIDLDMN